MSTSSATAHRAALPLVVSAALVALAAAIGLSRTETAGGASHCPKDYFCVWAGKHFKGQRVKNSLLSQAATR